MILSPSVKEKSIRFAGILVAASMVFLSCAGIPVHRETSGAGEGNIRCNVSIPLEDTRPVSILLEADGLLLITRNTSAPTGSGSVILEWEQTGTAEPFSVKAGRSGDTTGIAILPSGSVPARSPLPVTVNIPPGCRIADIQCRTSSSSLDLRLEDTWIRTLDIATTTGSSYIELSGCAVEAVHVESSYGRSYLLAADSTIASDLSMTGNPVEERITYYDKISGAAHIGLTNCSVGGRLRMESVAGKIELYADDTTLNGGIGISSDRAMQYLDLWNCALPSGAPVTASSDRGRIELRWAQHEANGEDMTFDITTGDEDIYFRVWGPFDINRYDITALAGTDLLEFYSLEDFDALEGGSRYRSKNYGDPLDLMTVHLRTDSREIYARVVDCYKPIRFCADFKVMKPMDPPF